MARARTFGQLLKERLDTMDAAFGDADVEDISAGGNHPSSGGGDAKGLVPMQAGVVKTGIQIAIAFWLFKKIKKVSDENINYPTSINQLLEDHVSFGSNCIYCN